MTSWHPRQALSLAAFASAALVAATSGGAATGEYVPFRTDFPQVAATERYTPFQTDFGITTRSPEISFVLPAKRQQQEQVAATAGLDWADAVLGAGFGFGVAALAATAALAVRGRRSQVAR